MSPSPQADTSSVFDELTGILSGKIKTSELDLLKLSRRINSIPNSDAAHRLSFNAILFVCKNDIAKAVSEFQKFARTFPNFEEGWFNFTQALKNKGYPYAACSLLSDCHSCSSHEIFCRRLMALVLLGDFERLERLLLEYHRSGLEHVEGEGSLLFSSLSQGAREMKAAIAEFGFDLALVKSAFRIAMSNIEKYKFYVNWCSWHKYDDGRGLAITFYTVDAKQDPSSFEERLSDLHFEVIDEFCNDSELPFLPLSFRFCGESEAEGNSPADDVESLSIFAARV